MPSKLTEQDFRELLAYKNFQFRGREKGGIDCFGFFLECCKRMGQEVPDYVYDEKNAGKLWLREYHKYFKKVDKPVPGDVILLKSEIIHIGIYIGNKQFLHFRRDIGVKVDRIYEKPWCDQIHGYFRYLNDGESNI
jgi:cell wall-associated NlpC family hydrolase